MRDVTMTDWEGLNQGGWIIAKGKVRRGSETFQ